MAAVKEMSSFKEMERRVNAYFAQCAAENVFPDEAGLILALGISEEMYNAYLTKDKRRYIPFRLCLENARLRRESILVRRLFEAGKRASPGLIFLARLPENGGLSEADIQAATHGGE